MRLVSMRLVHGVDGRAEEQDVGTM